MARPTDYNPKILKKAKKYIDSCVDEIEEYHKTRGEKSDSYDRLVRVKLPTIEGLAVYLGITRPTIYDWKEKHLEFSYIIDELQAIQTDRIINNGMSGDYSPVISKVLLAKQGYRDATELTGLEGKDLIPETIPKEKQEELLALLKK